MTRPSRSKARSCAIGMPEPSPAEAEALEAAFMSSTEFRTGEGEQPLAAGRGRHAAQCHADERPVAQEAAAPQQRGQTALARGNVDEDTTIDARQLLAQQREPV